MRDDVAAALTSDDSVVQGMVDAGFITAAQARAHPQRNQLLAALGVDDGVDPHTPALPQPLREGDPFLLCSDGWWDVVDATELASCLAGAASPDDWLQTMQESIEALAAPRQDNFSAIGICLREAQETTLPMTMALPIR